MLRYNYKGNQQTRGPYSGLIVIQSDSLVTGLLRSVIVRQSVRILPVLKERFEAY